MDNIKKKNNNNNTENIDMKVYNKDTTNLLLSDEDLKDILNVNVNTNNYIILAFKYLENNNIKKFRKLISQHKYIVNRKYNGTYLIHKACSIGNSEIVSFLMFTGVICNNLDDTGMMAQHHSIHSNETIIIDILALFGNDINVQDINGNTPLHHAIELNNKKMIEMLLEYKTDVNIKNNIGFTPRDYCLLDSNLKNLIK